MTRFDGAALDIALQELCRRNGSDLLLTVGAPPMVRVDGELIALEGPPLTPADTDEVVRAALGPDRHETFVKTHEVDFSFGRAGLARFRANAFLQRGSAALSVRLIPFVIPAPDDLGLPACVQQLAHQAQGLVLVTGPTGSGKSTTIASLIDTINSTRACHILTIEDPIEYVHSHKRSAVNQREVGIDTDSFAHALRSALREDPDVLLVGEMRDLETVAAALTLAETGHLVFASLHTNDAAQTVDRIVDVFPPGHHAQVRMQLGNVLSAVVSQRLVPRIGGGRVAAFEVMLANTAVRALIREGRTNQLQNQIVTGGNIGMRTMDASMMALTADGTIAA
jgi:twitching motility protein PilT